jgi:hypothetical protein
MVARLYTVNAGADLAHYAGSLMSQDRRENPFAVKTSECVSIGVANPGCHDLDENFSRTRAFEIDFDDFKRPISRKCYGSTRFHDASPGVMHPFTTPPNTG